MRLVTMNIVFSGTYLVLALTLASCKNHSERSKPDSFFSNEENAHLDVYKVSIRGVPESDMTGSCSAVAISADTLLAAKHCFVKRGLSADTETINRQAKNVSVLIGDKRLDAEGIFVLDDSPESTQSKQTTQKDNNKYIDLGLVRFPGSPFQVFASMGEQAPMRPEITVVGFGRTGFVRDIDYDIIFNSQREIPEQTWDKLAYSVEKREALTKEHLLYLESLSITSAVNTSTEYSDVMARVKNLDNDKKRSGASKLSNTASGILKDEFLKFVSNFTLKTDLDRKWFHLIQLVTPEGIVDSSNNTIAVSSGDSGGPMYDHDNNIIGIAHGVDSEFIEGKVSYTSHYTNLWNASVRDEFFAAAKARGFAIPQSRKNADATKPPADAKPENKPGNNDPSTPPHNPSNPTSPQKQVVYTSGIVVALASAENAGGDYFLAVASGAEVSAGWYCPSTDLQLCGTMVPTLASLSSHTEQGGRFLRTSTKVKIAELGRSGFSIILKRADDTLIGTSVRATKIGGI